ncbi:helix-turn-helix domain-containing protein [Pediococcus pentosaceus]|jgi:AraC-like DNA-binding protein|uniref:AraC family transcriptional regulator n=1 Tax=Pediococcus pentosaceus TaxID=1255 RepID=UPI0018A12A98|nr:AraC family transcriptional regulator [Pediococcus pentosaceus]MBF7139974.1 helix-turn-helix domain-containing protein [Pediococcus pentosaceus]MCM6819636.1 AraC family transcriptional regulator [Pediococcus pentosaceus]
MVLSLFEILNKEDRIEILQKQGHGININNMGLKYGPGLIPKIPKNSFFDKSCVAITKQHRYSYMPAHTHNFIELNYQFSGKSTQYINGREYILTPGQLLVMDSEVIQKYEYMQKNDILVNILLNLSDIPSDSNFIDNSVDSFRKFLFNAQDPKNEHQNYLIFDLSKSPEIKLIWEQLFKYALTNMKPFKTRELLLIACLSCLPEPKITNIRTLNSTTKSMVDIIKYIETNYKTVTLEKISNHFGYNKNYISNKIKDYTGLSFIDLLDRKRIILAENLLLDTNLSITEISNQIGYKNPVSLFRLFKKHLKITPHQFKSKHKNEIN